MSKSEKPPSPHVMISAQSRAALGQLKEFVRVNAPADKIDAHAFRLVGESQETIDRETRELFEALRLPFPREAFGLAFALRAGGGATPDGGSMRRKGLPNDREGGQDGDWHLSLRLDVLLGAPFKDGGVLI